MRFCPPLLAVLALTTPLLAAEGEPREKEPPIRFEEIGEAAGARYVHTTRSFGERPKAEVLEMFTDGGAAVAVGDFDGDGWDDLFLTESGAGRPQHLLRNVTGERGEIAFEEVTEAAGVAGGNEGDAIVGDAVWLDYDNDGRLDLLVVRFGTPLLYRNVGGEASDVRFEDVSAATGLAGTFNNSLAAITFDHDGDGWLDLLLGHYFPRHNLMQLETPHVLPNNLDEADNGGGLSLWKNVAGEDGARRFVEVTEEAGLAHHTGWSLDLGHADLDNDGDQDVYVAGDYGTDRLFRNDGDGTFTDVTEEAIGFDTRKGMNVDMGDYDRDGWLDVFVTNITDEYMRECNMLWHNNGDGTFLDLSRETGTCDSDWGWAGKFADLDNDGWEDIFTVNGLRSAGEENYIPVLLETIITPGIDFSDLHSYPDIGDRTWSGYQPQRLFRNLGDGTFTDVAAAAGVDNELDGRGIGVLDLDRDGRLDLVQTNARQPSLVFHNVSAATGHWVGLRLTGGEGSNRNAIGARVTLTAGGESWIREVDGGNGYASQSSLVVHVGLGEVAHVDAVEIRWPSGKVDRWAASIDEATGDATPALPIDTLSHVTEGLGLQD
ncbi:MAG TPA: CRTAC1 family protein [Thermoanaerobaculia bacterium]|nr:CRTAC1 family protein [Thermoanaerobaculia bacterium]